MNHTIKFVTACLNDAVLKDNIEIMVLNLSQTPNGNPPEDLVRQILKNFATRVINITLAKKGDALDAQALNFRWKLIGQAYNAINRADLDHLTAESHELIKAEWPAFCLKRDGCFTLGMYNLAMMSSCVTYCVLCDVDTAILDSTEEEWRAYKALVRRIAHEEGVPILGDNFVDN